MDYYKLCDVCDFQGGTQPPKDEWSFELKNGYLRMLQIRDFTQSEKTVPEYIKITNATKICDKDDILIARYGASLGKILTGLSGAYNVAIMKTIPNTEKLNKKYLYYYLKSPVFQRFLLNVGSRAAQAGFNKNDLKDLLIPNVSKKQQERIVEILVRIERVISLRKQQLAKLDELVKARFVELFGDLKTNPHNWQCLSLLDVAEIDTTMVTDYEKYADSPHIGIDSIEKNTGRLFGYRTIAEDGVISGKYLFTAKHIIYSKIRPNLNKVALPDFDGLCSADAYPILPKENVCLRIYLGYVMRSEFFLDYILPFSRRANMPKVNKEQLSGFVLPVPDIDLQKQFATFVEQIDKSKFAVQKALDEAQTLFDSLMQQYFG
ncbi:MAG: restriction endonuclease subunit S [Clostridia bacterium]|nr:restriction endonuclease subunit S [Clostridia bacterium]